MKKAIFNLRWAWGLGAMVLSLLPNWTRAATASVNIINFSFSPDSVAIHVGDTVTWTQKDATQHTSTAEMGLWNSPLLSLSQTFSHTFSTAGSFPYHCTPHPFMTGTVDVQATANQPPIVTISSPATGATFSDPNIVLEAAASDPDGSVTKVQFFEGRTSLGVVTSSPFRLTVPLAIGTHNLTAQATDNQGATGTSAVVSVTVTPPTTTVPTVSNPTRTLEGAFLFTIAATAGQVYVVQASADLLSWTSAQTITAPADLFTVTNTPAATVNSQFYRVQLKQ